jgi:hypothetical protein
LPYHFLMYPCAMTKDSVAVCTEAAKFTYRITSAELAV